MTHIRISFHGRAARTPRVVIYAGQESSTGAMRIRMRLHLVPLRCGGCTVAWDENTILPAWQAGL